MSKLKAKAPELTNPGHIKAVLFGKSGVGKTWLALNFPAATIQIFGVLFVLVGLNIIFYIPVMRHRQSLETFNNVEK